MPTQFKTLTDAVIVGEPGNIVVTVVAAVTAFKSR